MALIAFLIASLAAFFTSLIISPTGFHGLAPWIDRLSTSPAAPPPPPAFVPDLWSWEVIPTANLSSSPGVIAPLPTPTVGTVRPDENDEDDDEPRYAVPPPPEEPTAEELLRELWWLLKQVVLCITMDLVDFVGRNPYLRRQMPIIRLWRFYRRLTSLSRHRLRGRAQRRLSPRSTVPSAPAPAPPPSPPTPPPSPPSPPSASERALIEELRVQRERNLELEDRVGSLTAELNELKAMELDYIAEIRSLYSRGM